MRLLITGGAGFVGSRLALAFREAEPSAEIVTLDNLRRRGSELNLKAFKKNRIEFVHGDVRQSADLEDLKGNFDLIIDAAAEPSVLAGANGAPSYVIQSNLIGTINCLELARKRAGALIFLSTSRVYSIAPLREIALEETGTRLQPKPVQSARGITRNGISEEFETGRPRSLYGATKLASELLIQEYCEAYGLQALINRCGVIAGAGQFGKVDQGVFTLWAAHHHFGKPLTYTGFGGSGKQVRDLLHPRDLFSLLRKQLEGLSKHNGRVFNVGGGLDGATSLLELTALCRELWKREVPVQAQPHSTAVDIPWYVSDNSVCSQAFGWKPKYGARKILEETAQWLGENEDELRPLYG